MNAPVISQNTFSVSDGVSYFFKNTWLQYSVLILLAVLTRLPQLLSAHRLLDGDECIEGLMAKHLLEGKEFPVFFYGQTYGFSLLEILSIDLFFVFGGVSDVSVKLGILALWIGGVLLFNKTLRQICEGSLIPFLITVVLMCSPAWAVWSMKARGGYITAFFISALLLQLFTRTWHSKNGFAAALCGVLTICLYESQPLWIPGMLPLMAFCLCYPRVHVRSFIYFSSGAVSGYLAFLVLKARVIGYWMPDVFQFPGTPIKALSDIPQSIFVNMTGSYSYFDKVDLNPVTNLVAIIYSGAILLTILSAGVIIVKRGIRTRYILFYVFSLSMVLTLLYLPFLNGFQPRYLLPLMGFFLLALSQLLEMFFQARKNIPAIALGVMAATGVASLFGFRNYTTECQTSEQLKKLISYMDQHGITHVFSTHGFLQWHISFYSSEKIIARYTASPDRYQRYIDEVNERYSEKPASVAIVGYTDDFSRNNPDSVAIIDNTYFVLSHPKKTQLIERGFISEP